MPNIWSRICPQGHFWLKDQINRAHKSRERERAREREGKRRRRCGSLNLWRCMTLSDTWPWIHSLSECSRPMDVHPGSRSLYLIGGPMCLCLYLLSLKPSFSCNTSSMSDSGSERDKEAVLCGLRAVKNLLTSAKLTRHLNSIVEDVTRLQLYEKVVWEHADLTCQCSSPEVKMIIGPINACVQPSYCTDWRVFFPPPLPPLVAELPPDGKRNEYVSVSVKRINWQANTSQRLHQFTREGNNASG